MNKMIPQIYGLKAIEVENLSKRKGETLVLDSINLSIERGEFVGLLGSAGAGKSTLLRILAALDKPDSGKISLLGLERKSRLKFPLWEIGVWLEDELLIPQLTIWQNLWLVSAFLSIPLRQRKGIITKCLVSAGIWDMRNRTVYSLSRREKGIVNAIRATFHNPSLLLLDEPESELDSQGMRFILQQISRLREERNTAVLWASSKGEWFENADRVAIMKKGKIIAFDTPLNLERLISRELYKPEETPPQSISLREVYQALIGERNA
jgi:ABC-type multidrug transport system ATPase subunit